MAEDKKHPLSLLSSQEFRSQVILVWGLSGGCNQDKGGGPDCLEAACSRSTHFQVGWLTWVLAGGHLISLRLSTGLPEQPHDLAAGPWGSCTN